MSWEVKPLGEVCKTGAGGTPTKSVQTYYEPPSVPWLLSGEVEQREIKSTKNYISDEGLSKSSAKIFPPNSVLVAMYGANAGEVGVLKIAASTNQAVCAIYPSDSLHHDFIYFYLLFYQNDLASQAVGGAQPNISQTKVKAVPIPIPPLEEQQEIVALLDSAFEKIDKAKANVERNLKNAEELFQSALDEVFSNPGEDWEEKAIEDFALTTDYVSNGSFAALKANVTYQYEESFAILLRTTDYVNHWQKDFVYVDEASYHFLKKSSVQVGDLLISNVGKPGIAFLAPDLGRPMTIGPNAILIRCHAAVTNEFLLRFFQSSAGETFIRAITSGTTQLKFNKTNLRLSKVRFPTKTDQSMIVEELKSLEQLSLSLEHKYSSELDKLEELRQSILEQAFAGKLTSTKSQ